MIRIPSLRSVASSMSLRKGSRSKCCVGPVRLPGRICGRGDQSNSVEQARHHCSDSDTRAGASEGNRTRASDGSKQSLRGRQWSTVQRAQRSCKMELRNRRRRRPSQGRLGRHENGADGRQLAPTRSSRCAWHSGRRGWHAGDGYRLVCPVLAAGAGLSDHSNGSSPPVSRAGTMCLLPDWSASASLKAS